MAIKNASCDRSTTEKHRCKLCWVVHLSLLCWMNVFLAKPFDPTFLLSCTVSNVICCMVFGERFSYDDKEFLHLLHIISEVLKFSSGFLGQVRGGGSLKIRPRSFSNLIFTLSLMKFLVDSFTFLDSIFDLSIYFSCLEKQHCTFLPFHRCTTSFPGSWSICPAPSTLFSAILKSWDGSLRRRLKSTKRRWTPAPREIILTAFSSEWIRSKTLLTFLLLLETSHSLWDFTCLFICLYL